MPRKKLKKRKLTISTPLIVLGALMIGLAGVFSFYILPSLNRYESQTNIENMSHDEFIQTLEPHAKQLQQSYGILPSIILGQAILESNWGQSTLASQYYNLFGIKSSGNQSSIHLETQEYVNDQWITIQGNFRVYQSWEESMDDHTLLFVNGTDWNSDLYKNVLSATNYQEAATALQTAGYATDPDYAQKVINVIETYQLNQYD
ncbi:MULTISPECIES: glycoside hydrolase family 73 protein [Enterococcus]|uniref:Glycoside hydrolase family 73 protein n=1 Tax=Enterococcus alishanensis TaxID=1303817 RepID=A0ABS6TB02_9ENTE|nr:glycoside hydrolase family 73 protein [Enterococcus alishanensis]MBV7390088.1 glycoside hydrolase family 73 protein [Enterococcus alishanensis]